MLTIFFFFFFPWRFLPEKVVGREGGWDISVICDVCVCGVWVRKVCVCVTQVLENTILVNNSCRVYVMWSCGRNGWGRGERERERIGNFYYAHKQHIFSDDNRVKRGAGGETRKKWDAPKTHRARVAYGASVHTTYRTWGRMLPMIHGFRGMSQGPGTSSPLFPEENMTKRSATLACNNRHYHRHHQEQQQQQQMVT